MIARAKDGTCLDDLIQIAIPVCKEAERYCPRTGRGRRPDIPDWVLSVLIMATTFKKKKSKNAQWHWIMNNSDYLTAQLEGHRLPSRSTYYERFRRAKALFEQAIRILGKQAVRYGWADASVVSVDKSLMSAKGPKWWRSDRTRNRIPKGLSGVDQESQWGYSSYHGWVQGYSYEIVVSSGKNGVVWPLLASVDTANVSEHQSFEDKISDLPKRAQFVLADSGYDNNRFAERIEWNQGERTGVRFLCPQNKRNSAASAKPVPKYSTESRANYRRRMRRADRNKYFQRSTSKSRYKLRSQTIEPFNEWFKSTFDFNVTVWHRGRDNNQTQVLAAIFAYQVSLRYNRLKNIKTGAIRHVQDRL